MKPIPCKQCPVLAICRQKTQINCPTIYKLFQDTCWHADDRIVFLEMLPNLYVLSNGRFYSIVRAEE